MGRGLGKRLGYFLNGVVHMSLAVAAVSMLTGAARGGGGDQGPGLDGAAHGAARRHLARRGRGGRRCGLRAVPTLQRVGGETG